MIKQTLVATAAALLAISASAATLSPGSYPLEDGSTLHVFADGKMGMENQYGLVLPMAEGATMETADGHTLAMRGNELARTAELLRDGVD